MKDIEIVLMGIVLSDSTVREMGSGKVSYIGTFHQYQSGVFPLFVPPFFVTPILTNIKGKLTEPIAITIRIEDPRTGAIMANTVGTMAIPSEFTFTGTEVIDFPFQIAPITFPGPGTYQINVMVDGEKIGSRPLPVFSVTAMQQPPKP